MKIYYVAYFEIYYFVDGKNVTICTETGQWMSSCYNCKEVNEMNGFELLAEVEND